MGIESFDQRRDQFEDEIYRRKLYHMHYRLKKNLAVIRNQMRGMETPHSDHAYRDVQDYLDDLYSIRDSLISHGDYAAANGDLKDVIRIAETFGFHLVSLDLRQESAKHTRTVSEILRLALVSTTINSTRTSAWHCLPNKSALITSQPSSLVSSTTKIDKSSKYSQPLAICVRKSASDASVTT